MDLHVRLVSHQRHPFPCISVLVSDSSPVFVAVQQNPLNSLWNLNLFFCWFLRVLSFGFLGPLGLVLDSCLTWNQPDEVQANCQTFRFEFVRNLCLAQRNPWKQETKVPQFSQKIDTRNFTEVFVFMDLRYWKLWHSTKDNGFQLQTFDCLEA